MTSNEDLPPELGVLADDLSSPGPAVPQALPDARTLVQEAMREAALDPAHTRRTVGPRRVLRLAAAVVVLGASSAAAAWFAVGTGEEHSDAEVAPPSAARTGSQVQEPARTEEAPEQRTEQPAERETEPLSPRTQEHSPSPSAKPKQDLLAEANRLRRVGEVSKAEQMYLEVVRKDPRSSAAYVARVAVAQMRLPSHPQQSVRLLQQAQATVPEGALDREIREALARGYRALGQQGAERRELSQLLKRYPDGFGADAARRRLKELTKGAP